MAGLRQVSLFLYYLRCYADCPVHYIPVWLSRLYLFLETVRDSRLVLRYVGRVPVLNYHVWVLILIIIKLVTVEQTFHYLRL